MKKYVYILMAVIIASASVFSCINDKSGKEKTGLKSLSSSDTASIYFREYEHNFGKISEGEKVACTFIFENRGTGPLNVLSATTTCGCTVPKYDTRPIQPGEKGSLEVVFDSSGRNGIQSKTITVSSNATRPVVLLKITGEVISNNK